MPDTRKRPWARTRSDSDTWSVTPRDRDGMRFTAEQKVVRLDTLAEYFAPNYAPAKVPSPEKTKTSAENKETEETEASTVSEETKTSTKNEKAEASTASEPKKRGGNRAITPWPPDLRHRLMAVRRIVYKWVDRGHAELWQPWRYQPAWVKLTQAGLHELGLDVDEHGDPYWTELEWPDMDKLRDDRGSKGRSIDGSMKLSHYHRINQIRMALARGDVKDIPAQHIWHSEREVEATLPKKEKGVRLPHKTDGYVELEKECEWELPLKEGFEADEQMGVPKKVVLPAGSKVAIEVELSRKRFAAYEQYILPDLLRFYDFALYFCTKEAYQAIMDSRRDRLHTNEQRKRIRVISLQ